MKQTSSSTPTVEYRRLRAELRLDTTAPYYECKALGIRLLEAAGWTKGQIRQLSGHSTERMVAVYTDPREVQFEVTRAGSTYGDSPLSSS